MTRQVDVKALVSHIVRGDGVNKCRICMGDTSEGQVYLNDTVMMVGDKPVTLSELLETVTGIQVEIEGDLPEGVCPECSKSALNAAEFRSICQEALQQWNTAITLLHDLPTQCTDKNTIFAVIEKTQMIAINDKKKQHDLTTAAKRLTKHLERPAISQEESLFSCPNCNKPFTNAFKLSQHLKQSVDLRACYICGTIVSQKDLLSHIINEHNEMPFDCKKCSALFCSFSQYTNHVAKAHINGPTLCVECGRRFQSSKAYYAHISVHTSKTCPSCDKLFRNHSCYIYHVKHCCHLDTCKRVVNTKRKVMVEVKNGTSNRKIKVGLRGSTNKECICDYCSKKFAGKKFIAAHIQIVHMKNTHGPCIYCGKLLASAHMSEHLKRHESDRIYTCQQCGVILKTKLGYNQHLRLHTGEKPYACKFCGETFSASSRRSEHVRNVHKSSDIVLKQQCHMCPAKFRLPYRLKKHLKSVHNDDQDQTPQFECNECHEKFSSCRGLLHHSRKHQNITLRIRKPKIRLNVVNEENMEEEKVVEEPELPLGLCSACADIALSAWHFRHLCHKSYSTWTQITSALTKPENPTIKDRAFFITTTGALIKDFTGNIHTSADAIKKLNFSNTDRNKIRTKYKKKNIKIGANKCQCKDCKKQFQLPYFLNRHLINSSKRACTLCAKTVPKEKLPTHLAKSHQRLVEFCDICYKVFEEKSLLYRHKEILHGDSSLQCSVCKNGFQSERSLRAHMYTHTLFDCSSCNSSFENRKCYLYHKNICKGSKVIKQDLYECHDCGIKYTKKPSLRVHIVQKHLHVLPFICQVCGKRSASKTHHQSHELVHKTERKVYQCYCGAKMRTIHGFQMHQRIHSGEKPYECQECGDRFLSASRRLDHIKRKHRRKDLACSECEARFVRPSELKKHWIAVHHVYTLI